MAKTVSAKVNRQTDSWIEKETSKRGLSRSEFLKGLIEKEMNAGGDGAKAPPEVLTLELPDHLEPQTPNEWDIPIEWDDTAVERNPPEKVNALKEDSDVQKLWDAIQTLRVTIESLKEDQKEFQGITMLAIDKLVDQAVMNLELSKASLELSRKIVTRLQSEETVPEAPPEEPPEEPTEEEEPPNIYGRILEYLKDLEKTEAEEAPPEEPPEEEGPTIHVLLGDVDGGDDGAGERLKVSDEVLDQVSDQVKENVTPDLMEWRQKMYDEVKDEVRDHLNALRDSDNALNLRLIRFGDSVESLATRIEALVAEEVATPEEAPEVEVEARTGLAPPKEALEDILVICGHGGTKRRIGFTKEDRKGGVAFCPRCGRRVTYT